MNDSEIMDQQSKEEVQQWLDQLLAGAGQDRKQAASELSRLGVRTRGSIRPRGLFNETPKNRLPEPEKIKAMVQYLKDQDQEVRNQVALALGEWGGEEESRALSQILSADPDEDMQLYCITALRTVGGPTAAEALRQAALKGTEAVRGAAISALEDLVTGGRIDCTEGPDIPLQPEASTVRVSGAVRTRGAIQTRGGAETYLVSNVADTLQQVRNDKAASDYLRLRAEEVLRYFRE